MNNRIPADQSQRELAVDPRLSIICEAPAGSGKTELLTLRFLNLLLTVEKPEQILAITFTRKAAAEMSDRILSALQWAGTAEAPADSHKKKLWFTARQVLEKNSLKNWLLLENPNQLQIKTFDSLCAQLAGALPFISQLGANAQISEEPDLLYKQAANNILLGLETESPWTAALKKLLLHLDVNYQRVERLLSGMLSIREQWLPYMLQQNSHAQSFIQSLEANMKTLWAERVEAAKNKIPLDCQLELIALSCSAAANMSESDSVIRFCCDLEGCTVLPAGNLGDGQAWQGLVSLLLTQSGSWRKSINKNQGFPSDGSPEEKKILREKRGRMLALLEQFRQDEELLALLNEINYLPSMAFSKEQEALLFALAQVLPALVAHLMLVFREHNQTDFSEVSARARMALGGLDNPGQLALKLDYTIQHILVDEFQDTSASNMQLINQLTAGWQVDDGRTFFCVGDAMQSIYSFRGANVGMFMHALKYGLENVELKAIKLTANFRSQENLVNWVNQIFSTAFPQANDISSGAVSYTSSTAFLPAGEGEPVCLQAYDKEAGSVEEARSILAFIRETQQEDPLGTIAVLVRGREHAVPLMRLLKKAAIKYRAVEMEALHHNMLIQDLMALSLALLYPADRISWLAILRAPWCSLSLVDLEFIASQGMDNLQGGPLPTVYEQLQCLLGNRSEAEVIPQVSQHDFFSIESGGKSLTEDGQRRIERVFPVLEEALQQSHRRSLRHWVEGVWLKLGGPACLQELSDGANARMFFDLLESLDSAGILDRRESLQRAVEKRFSMPDPESDERLQIMTIHKAKGLEFDTVIVPGMQKGVRANTVELLAWYERVSQSGQSQLMMAPVHAAGQDKSPTEVHLAREAQKRLRYESQRLLYVACSRAKKKLFLSAQFKVDEDKQLQAPPKASLLHSIWGQLEDDFVFNIPEKNSSTSLDNNKKYFIRLAESQQAPGVLEDCKPGERSGAIPQLLSEEITATSPDLQWRDVSSRQVGTVIHRFLQSLGEKGWQVSSVERKGLWRKQLIALGVSRPNLVSAMARCESISNKLLEDDKVKSLLNVEHEYYCEFPISFSGGGAVQHHVIDLLVVDRPETDGSTATWIVDYKTSEPEKGESQEAFIKKEKKNYTAQLQAYKLTVENLGYKNVKTALYFPLIQSWLELF